MPKKSMLTIIAPSAGILFLILAAFINYESDFLFSIKMLFNATAFAALSYVLIGNNVDKIHLWMSVSVAYSIINGLFVDLFSSLLKAVAGFDLVLNPVLSLVCFIIAMNYIYIFYVRIFEKYFIGK